MQQLVLASTSPRRRELLALLGVTFEVCPPTFEEHPISGLPPRDQAARFAREKAHSVAFARPADLIIGSDTVIEIDGKLLGKPAGLTEARTMLMHLAGRAHEVHTAVALCCRSKGIECVEVATACVVMHPVEDQAITKYLETGESLGRAGAYSIQGAGGSLIDRIEGDYTTIVGLPLKVVAKLLECVRWPVPEDLDKLYRRKPYPNWNRFSA